MTDRLLALEDLHDELASCRRCPGMQGDVVTPHAVTSSVLLLGQAPGVHEAELGRPFAWTAGRTLFRWMSELGFDEDQFRASIYMAAVCRCFPGKAKGGGDRVPSRAEIANCAPWLERAVALLEPRLVIPVGRLAIEQVGLRGALVDIVGRVHQVTFAGRSMDAIPLPHPSGVSAWPKKSPGKELLRDALELLRDHEAVAHEAAHEAVAHEAAHGAGATTLE